MEPLGFWRDIQQCSYCVNGSTGQHGGLEMSSWIMELETLEREVKESGAPRFS